ncbi:uncharacterized protein LOC141611024 isoform X2 [Silene latifolia]|uniref:uncharacterized protein LOC141611024 isoform X2 n=1 Tax=Silene latifolia TaxID=37657 RepID=UPI003D787836
MPRNSKIPRVPISKHTSSSGSHLKSPAIAQPVQKSTSLTLPSNIKSASKVASIGSGGTSKSIKHLAANARKDSTCSSLEFGSSTTNHKARSTAKVSNCLQNNSKQGLQVKMIETVNGTSKSRISSQLPSDNGDGNTKDAQSQGFKASGLRMPSPSMKFFSEGNKKSSNLKSSIPTLKKSEAADHISDFKQIKVQHGSLNHDAVSKKRLSSQVTELCSTVSLIDPIEHTEAKHAERSQQVVQEEAPLRDKVPHPTNNADDMKNPVNDIDFQCIKENPTSLTVEEEDMNKFVDINGTDPSLNQNRNADGNTKNSSFASCSKVQLTGASSAIGDVCPTVDEETGCSSSATNDGDLLESDIDFSGQHNNYTLAADSNPSTSMLNKEKNPGECMIDNLVQSNSEGNINLQLGDSKLFADDQSSSDMDEGDSDSEETRSCIPKCGIVGGAAYEYVNKEQDDVMFNGDLSATKFGECSIEQDVVCNHIPHNENSNTSTTLKISGSKEISDVDSISSEPESTVISNHSRTSFLELSNNDADQLPYLLSSVQGTEEPPLFHGHEIINSGCQHASLVASNNGTEAATNSEVELAQEENDASIVNLAVSKGDDMDLSNCVQLHGNIHNRHHEGNNIEISEEIHQVHSGVQEVEFPVDLISCLSDKGNNSTFQTDGTVSAEEPETNCNMEGICSDYGTEVNTNRDTELSQVVIDDSMVSLATSEREISELNNAVILKDCSLGRDQEGSNIEISDDIHQVHASVEDVETQTDSVSCLSSKGNNSTFQTDGSVSAEEPETNCTMEGICSDYGTEADINRDIELSQVLNDDSMVNLATSEREILEFYNGVRLKDCSLSKEHEGSNIGISDDIHQVHISLEEVETQTDSISCLSSKGNNSTFQTDGSVSAEVPEIKCDMEGICSIYGTEATINRSTEFAQVVNAQVVNDDLIVNMETSKGDDIDWNNGVVLKDSFLKRDQGGSNIEISGDICQVHNCVEEVEFLTDWIICLPSKGSYAAHQIDDSVSADEYESNCNIEGICSDCGPEATINSILNMTTSKREDVVLNNGVVLKDSFLKSVEGGSNIEISGDIRQMDNSVEEVEFLTDLIICLPSKGSYAAHQIDDSVSAEEPESNCNIEGIFSDCGTEATINRSTEFTEVANDDSIVNMTTSKRGDVDLNNGVVLNDSFLKSDEGGSNIEISGDIHQMHNSVEEVEFLTDLIICLPSKGSYAAHQIDDSVSADEYESNCNIEGICSDCGPEATINSSTEFAQVVNVDSILNMTTSKREDVVLNNGVVLKDSFLKSVEGGSNIEISGDIRQMDNSVEEVEFLTDLIICLPSKGSHAAHQIDDSVSAEEHESNCSIEGIFSDCGTESSINRSTEFTQVVNDDSIVNMTTSKRGDVDLNNGVVLKDSFLKSDEGGSNIEISGDICQMHNSVEEVEFLTDLIICLPSKGSNVAHQIDDSVSAEEPESKCIAEGICSDCGTEDIINRNIEFSEGMNDVSIVNLATSERDDMDLNNGVVLKDSFLKTDQDGSNIEISGDIHQVHSRLEELEFLTDSVSCHSSKGNNAAHQIDGSVSEEEPESKCIEDGICSDCGTEDIINRNIEFPEGMNDVSIVNLATSERDYMDLNNGVPLKDNFLKTDRDGSDIEISAVIHQVNSSVKEVEFQTDSVSCLSSKGNNAALQIDGSVSEEEPESKCNMEGICSDCGTEATINRNIEFSERKNDNSIVNLATFERDDMDLNNSVSLKDSFLKTDRDGSDIEISAVIHQVNSSVKEVEFQTDSVSCPSSKANNATYQIDGSVSTEEYENKCNTEGIDSLEEVNANLERTDNQKVTIPAPPHAVPFSDEWLAAIESAGEEILTMKTGAVQHSPTDKSIPEPSPWSPVKRKTAQVIGPFDCTKHTHIQPDQSE